MAEPLSLSHHDVLDFFLTFLALFHGFRTRKMMNMLLAFEETLIQIFMEIDVCL